MNKIEDNSQRAVIDGATDKLNAVLFCWCTTLKYAGSALVQPVRFVMGILDMCNHCCMLLVTLKFSFQFEQIQEGVFVCLFGI